ncbi:hypothetical protein [Hymenobacter terrenus]|uniref:hypothetical protein n=1 Tax=Hymenobacter terrenus TaxID=1629124 RepID=UPI0006191BF5|nr:hypothetical protein [Hymenobacter terrenus]
MLPGPPTQLLALQDGHGAALAEFFYHPDKSLLHVRWHGHLTSGDWSEALPWLQYEWLPQVLTAGVQAIAYVFSPDHANQFATQRFVEAVRPRMAIELFADLDMAVAWLVRQRHDGGIP